jgi:ATP-binding cassette subfamily B protein
VLLSFAVAAGSLVVQNALAPVQTALAELIARRIDGRCIQRLMTVGMTEARLDLLDQPDVRDRLSHAYEGLVGQWQTPGAAGAGLLALIPRYTQIVGAVCVVGVALNPLAGVVLAVTFVVLRVGSRSSLTHWSLIIQDRLAGLRRKMWHVFDMGSDPAIAKEARVLGLLPWLHARARRDSEALLGPLWRERRRVYFWPFLGITALMLVGTYVVMFQLSQASAQGLSVLSLSLAAQAILIPLRMGTFFPESDLKTLDGMAVYDSITSLVRSFSGSDAQAVGRAPVPGVRSVIRFEGVSFRYPGSQREVLSGLDLDLPVGRSTAIVGLNGAGKTSMVKLLAGLYEPTGGRITVDGTDLRALDPAGWRRQLALVFQDYVRFELDVEANVGFGAPAHMTDREALHGALELARAAEFVRRLPAGTATPLSSRYDGGVDLSGGQWQRIALARAFFAVKAGASVLVLDEPTSQLDIRAEAAFFDQFLELTRGLTTVIISHRFSTVRRADSIVVLANGRVAEAGRHSELLRDGGRYARLFHLQARRFVDDRGEAVE